MKIDADLLDTIVTQEQADIFNQYLDKLGEQLYIDNGKLHDKLSNLMPTSQIRIINEAIYRNQIDENDPRQIETLIDEFKKSINRSPRVGIIIATNLPADNLVGLSKWFRINSGKSVLLDIVIDPKIIGGAIIRTQGNWRDYSLSKKAENIIGHDEDMVNILNAV